MWLLLVVAGPCPSIGKKLNASRYVQLKFQFFYSFLRCFQFIFIVRRTDDDSDRQDDDDDHAR